MAATWWKTQGSAAMLRSWSSAARLDLARPRPEVDVDVLPLTRASDMVPRGSEVANGRLALLGGGAGVEGLAPDRLARWARLE